MTTNDIAMAFGVVTNRASSRSAPEPGHARAGQQLAAADREQCIQLRRTGAAIEGVAAAEPGAVGRTRTEKR